MQDNKAKLILEIDWMRSAG